MTPSEELDAEFEKLGKKIGKELASLYSDLLYEAKRQLAILLKKTQGLTTSQKNDILRYSAIYKEISEMIGARTDNIENAIINHKELSAFLGYTGAVYEMESYGNIDLDVYKPDLDYVEQVVNHPVAGKNLSERIHNNTTKLASAVSVSLQRGAAEGKGYADISRLFSGQFGMSYRNAMRIARTEGGRVRTITSQKAYEDGLKLGVKDLKKQWLATLDIKTRPQHGILDGQIVPADGTFKYGDLEAIGPRCFLSADLDINCRCTTIPVIDEKEQEDRLRRDNMSGKNGNWKNYSEWQKWKDEQLKSQGSSFAIERKKVLNQASDKKQAKKYRSVGIKTGDINAFQQIKYNNPEEYNSLKAQYSLLNGYKTGKYDKVVNVNKQAPHNYATRQPGKSYLLEGVDAQKLFNEYVGMGKPEVNKKGYGTGKETIRADKIIGVAVSKKRGAELTEYFKIHNSKKGAHIVPSFSKGA
ncbi:MAG: hypothetical protein LBT91_00350 [Bifidobacteriaceae bacterium]|jgi:SPP1 gp7 family putative phage head morphogenesis protein|nr:hypothetical protein [Bifidobacteriaceae bacterium]